MSDQTVVGTLVVARCPLKTCNWRSVAYPEARSAREEQRRHVSEHDHADLIGFIFDLPESADLLDVYNKTVGEKP